METEKDVFAVNKSGEDILSGLPLAMAYVPMQKWNETYEPAMALARGTLFPELDKPFLGEAVK